MTRRPTKSVLLLIVFMVLLRPSYGWKEQMHKQQLTWQALNLLELQFKNKYPEEIWTKYRAFIEQGAYDEDFPCCTKIRANNHYRHAISGHGLTDAPYIGLGDPDVGTLAWAKTNPIFSAEEEFKNGEQWEGFKQWHWTAADVENGNMSWRNAVNRFGYTDSAKQLAYYTLGFLQHLLQDMGDPEHVHDDPHGASGYTGFEMWIHQNYPGANINTLKPVKYASLDAFFKTLGNIGYSIDRFQGGELSTEPPVINPAMSLARMFRIEYGSIESEWRILNVRNERITTGDFAWDRDDYEKSPIWTKGHDEGEWWPSSMEMFGVQGNPPNDEPGYYYIELSGDAPGDRIRQLFPAVFIPAPLKAVAGQCQGWAVDNVPPDMHLYKLIADRIVPPVVAFSAGLIQYYSEIVNHPPYVKSLKVLQGEKTKYSATWKDKEELRQGSRTVRDVVSRSLKKGTDSPVFPGVVTLQVAFSEPVKDKDIIKVRMGKVPAEGKLDDSETVWTGTVELKAENIREAKMKIAIEAVDKDVHYKDDGGKLDADPATPARRVCSFTDSNELDGGSESYAWEGYKAGADETHEVSVKTTILVDPVRVQVLDQAGSPISDQSGLVSIDGRQAFPAQGEYWGKGELEDSADSILIKADYRMPDGTAVSGSEELRLEGLQDTTNYRLTEPVVIRLPVFAPGSFILNGTVNAVAPQDENYPELAIVRNEMLGVEKGVYIAGGVTPRNIIEAVAESIFGSDTPRDGSFSAKVTEPVQPGSALKLTVSGNSDKREFQAVKSMPLPAAPGTVDFGVITLKAIMNAVRVPSWDSANPPAFPDYEGALRAAGLAGRPKLGRPAPESRLQFRVESTVPSPGSELAPGTEVTVLLHGKHNLAVPDVIGLTAQQAVEILKDRGFEPRSSLGPAAEAQDRQYTVVNQTPPPGTEHPPGQPVAILIMGKFVPTLVVPDLTGMIEDEARGFLGSTGLEMTVKDRSAPASDPSKAEQIWKQQPPPNSKVGTDAEVEAWIYAGSGQTPTPTPPTTTGPASPFYAVFELTFPTPPQDQKPKKQEGESDEAYVNRKQAFYRSLPEGEWTLKPLPAQDNPLVFHFSQEALSLYSRGKFGPESKYACKFSGTGSQQGRSFTLKGTLLLTAKATFDSLDQVIGAYPKIKTNRKFQAVAFSNNQGTAPVRSPEASLMFGPLTPGWTSADKRDAIDLAIAINSAIDCFVATAVYGDPEAPEVLALRSFRDKILLGSAAGGRLVELYYTHGPGWARAVKRNPWLRVPVRAGLDVLVAMLDRIDLSSPQTAKDLTGLIGAADGLASSALKKDGSWLDEIQRALVRLRFSPQRSSAVRGPSLEKE